MIFSEDGKARMKIRMIVMLRMKIMMVMKENDNGDDKKRNGEM